MTKSISKFMGDDHDRLDALFEEFRTSKRTEKKKAESSFHEFVDGLTRHIRWEEDLLFPIFEEKTGMRDAGPTAVMREEHKMIHTTLKKMQNMLASGDAATDNLEDELISVLCPHNAKEEQVLYPWIDDVLDEDGREKLIINMNAT